jgi:hypothetical protein
MASDPQRSRLTRSQIIAVLVALIAGTLALVLSALGPDAVHDGCKAADDLRINGQLSAIGGVVLALLIKTVVQDRRWTLALATLGVFIGAAAPWLARLIEGPSAFYSLALRLQTPGPALFAFGVSFLVKSTEARHGQL